MLERNQIYRIPRIDSLCSLYFDSVQERINAEYHPKQRREASSTAHWLSGLLKCGTCGSSLGFCRSKDQKKRPDFSNAGDTQKDSTQILAAYLHESPKSCVGFIKSAIDTQSINYEYVPSADIQNQSEEALIQEALTRLETKERRIKEAYENEVDTLEEYKDNKCRLQAERKSLLTSLERLHQEQPDFSNQIAHKQKLLAEIATIYDFVLDPNVSNEDKGNALRRVLKKIVFDRKTSVFTFFYYVS